MSDLERARSALMLEIGAWGINLNASEDVDACVVALIAAAKREGVREWIEGLPPDSAVGIAQFIDKATPRPATLGECGALMQQALLNALAKEGE